MLSDGGEGSIAGVLDPLSYPLLPAVSCCLSSKSWLAPSPFSPSVSRALSPLLAPAQLSTLPSLATAIDSGQAGRSMASCRRGARFAAANRTGVAPRCPVSYGRKWRAARSRTRRIPSPAPAPACTSPAPRPRQHCTDLCRPASPSARPRPPPAPPPTRRIPAPRAAPQHSHPHPPAPALHPLPDPASTARTAAAPPRPLPASAHPPPLPQHAVREPRACPPCPADASLPAAPASASALGLCVPGGCEELKA